VTLKFEILHQSKRSRARVGCIHTPHGTVDTPGFVAVGTNATLKGLDSLAVDAAGLQLMFCNTYHLLLQPGTEVVKKAGGLHAFTGRKGPIITDSGGFQVFSLAYGSVAQELKSQGTKQQEKLVLKITEEGVLFRSYRDGNRLWLTPESSVQAQKDLGADIIIPLDELPPYHIERDALAASLARTHRWEKRSLEAHLANPQGQAIYGVVHGGLDLDLRSASVKELSCLPFDGFALGGSMGKTRKQMVAMLAHTLPQLPTERPTHLLGIGDLESLENCIPLGIDTFDSSYPTRAARHGVLLTEAGPLKIEKRSNRLHFDPPERGCRCSTCRSYSLAYLHHLFKARELSALSLATAHNLHFMMCLMRRYREAILDGAI
jgi:queuine tRNA-ribosyltransferase